MIHKPSLVFAAQNAANNLSGNGHSHFGNFVLGIIDRLFLFQLYLFFCPFKDACRFAVCLSENFFLLEPSEEKTVRITADRGEVGEISVSLWNGEGVIVP